MVWIFIRRVLASGTRSWWSAVTWCRDRSWLLPTRTPTCTALWERWARRSWARRRGGRGVERFRDQDIEGWAAEPPQPDADAAYSARIVLDLTQVSPHVSGPDTVQIMASLAEVAKQKTKIQKAYLLSCVNSRVEDLAAAANVLQGKKVADGVQFYLGAASHWVQEEAERRGIWQTLLMAA